jgi:pimeloyl-ACP methyl ester carboxylesterase
MPYADRAGVSLYYEDSGAGPVVLRQSETDADMFALLLEAWASEPGGWANFPRVQAPTLIICGEREEPHAADNARLAAQTLPSGSVTVLPGLHHLQAFWRTDLTLPPLLGFFSEHLRAAAHTPPPSG